MKQQIRSAGIVGVGSYVPEKVLTNLDLEKMVDTNDEWIKTRTGISERRIASEDQATSDLALIAAQRALADAGVSPEELDLIIVATATPDMFFPSTACIIQEKLGANKAGAFDLAAACSGFIYGISVASQFIAAGTYKTVLVIGAEALSKITDWSDRNTCVLFGDGAGAVVLQPVEDEYGVLSVYLGSDGSGGELLKIPAGGSRMPATNIALEERLNCIKMAGSEVFKFAVKIMGEAAVQALENAGLKSDDIDLLIPHQANTRIIEAAAKRLGVPMEKVFVNVEKYGNTSAASIGIALDEAVKSKKIKDGDIIVSVGFGGGLTWAASVIRWGGKRGESIG